MAGEVIGHRGQSAASTTAGWNAATPDASRRGGSTYGLPDLAASSGALIRTDAADSLSR